MTDFYALLKQSILDRGIRNVGERQEIYAQARRAVIKQLWDYRPPLAADEIDQRVGAYDTAVERIETELQTAFANGETLRPKSRQQAAPLPARQSPVAAFTDWPDANRSDSAGMERAVSPASRSSRAAVVTRRAAVEPGDDADYGDEPYLPRDQSGRWFKRGAYERPDDEASLDGWAAWLPILPELTKVRVGAIAAGALVVLLVGVAAYQLGARSSDQSVTLPIGVRRQVSDAATAARIPDDSVKVAQAFSLFDGRDPTVFATTPDNPVGFDSAGGFARVTSSTSAPGVEVTIGPGLAARLAGQNVRVVILARSSKESGAAGMRFAYQSGLAISHWQTANLGPDYAPVGMEWRVPAMQTSETGDSLLIQPGIPGDGTGVDVKSIRIDVLAS